MHIKKAIVSAMILAIFTACQNSIQENKNSVISNQTVNSANKTVANSSQNAVNPNVKPPASDKGNISGKVLYNDKPVENIEVKLCEKFNSFMMNCDGQTYSAKTDKDGDYLIDDVTPREYEGLTVRVFTSNYYVYPASLGGISKKHNIEAGKTYFPANTNLFKDDVKILNPKSGSKVDLSKGLELKWSDYPDAAYYKVYVSWSGTEYKTSPYVGDRVDGTSFAVEKPLENGTYSLRIEAFNEKNTKLATSSNDIKFSVTNGQTAPN
ncbi:MAG: carboxypeptidase regulatory-like domain-containing protein [Pyrinomonadaceae bacterium]|nr:carboxypeptidase regulatory-like domain-containing protein [Pyrinomonadaceae bacterium]